MKITCETLTELNSTIEQIIAKYEVKKYIDDGSIWPLATQPDDVLHKRSIDPNAKEWLKTIATKARTCAINLFQQNPQLPEPPKPESEPLIELQQIRQWCIRAEAPTQPEQKPPASGKAGLPIEKSTEMQQNINIQNFKGVLGNVQHTENLQIGDKPFIQQSIGTKDKKKGILRRIPYWIYILVLFLAAVLTCLSLLGWLEPIKELITNGLWPK